MPTVAQVEVTELGLITQLLQIAREGAKQLSSDRNFSSRKMHGGVSLVPSPVMTTWSGSEKDGSAISLWLYDNNCSLVEW